MNPVSPAYRRLAAPAVVAAAAFLYGLIHHILFFPLVFHADASAMLILAQAMVDQVSLLPADFVFGNQLTLFRSSPFIALALALGWSGYDAFIAGSAASLAFWALVLYAGVREFSGEARKAVALTLVFLIPMGHWDNDFVLGQQSHLSNAVMAICIVVLAWRYLSAQVPRALALGALLVFLMTLEVPIRAALVLLALGLAVLLFFDARRALRCLLALGAAFVLGFLCNKGLLALRPVAVDLFSTYRFHTLPEMSATLGDLALETLVASVETGALATKRLSPTGMLMFGIALSYLVALYTFGGAAVANAIGRFRTFAAPRREAPDGGLEFISVVAALGMLTGALAVAGMNPDTGRHYIWAYSLLKLAFYAALYRYVTVTLGWRARGFAVVALAALVSSTWSITAFSRAGRLQADAARRNGPAIVAQIDALARQHGVKHVFGGDFWRMLPLNTTVPGIGAGVLSVTGNQLHARHWLTRRSWFQQQGPVLYYLRDEAADRVATTRLQQQGGKLLHESAEGRLWIGPPVWDKGDLYEWNGCALHSGIGQPNEQCHLVKKSQADTGYLSYGPYVKLETGTYRFTLTYAGTGAQDAVIGDWDLAIEQPGKVQVLRKGPLKPTGERSMNLSGEFTVTPAQAHRSVEVRVFSHANGGLRVEHLRIERVARRRPDH